MVHHHGAEAFRSFAEVTYYDKDLEQCIPSDLRQIIEDFLNKVLCMCIVWLGNASIYHQHYNIGVMQ